MTRFLHRGLRGHDGLLWVLVVDERSTDPVRVRRGPRRAVGCRQQFIELEKRREALSVDATRTDTCTYHSTMSKAPSG